ncbi:MAG: TerD family protein, partial [Geodermatophilaceae bacterium]
VSLVKTGAPALSTVAMGLGWDANTGGKAVDLDASCIAFNAGGKDVDKVWFTSKSGCNKSIRHSGDNLTGHGDGDDEVITVDLPRVPADVAALVFTVNSYSGQDFTNVRNAYARLLDTAVSPRVELVRYELSDSEPTTGVLMCALRRVADGSWTMTALGEFAKGRTVRDMVKPARAALG